MFICENLYQEAYRIKNKDNTTPIITITHAPSVPPIIVGTLFDEEAVWRYCSASGKIFKKI